MSKTAKILHRALRRKCIFSALSLLLFILNAFGASSHDKGVGITRTLLQTGEIEQRGYLSINGVTSFDDGGKDIQPSTLRIREHKLDFTLPDIPQIALNPGTGELELTDADGNPHTIQIDIPENAPYESIFPMIVTDDRGNSYQLTPAEQLTDGADNAGQQGKVPLQADRVERVGDFSTDALSDRYGHVRFERGEGRYAFDAGTDDWYKKSVKLDRFYKPFAQGYIAPWKLVPVGESDVVTARYDGRKDIDLRKVRFVSEPNAAALPAQGGRKSEGKTANLMDYAGGKELAVFQWNIMVSPAVFTVLDDGERLRRIQRGAAPVRGEQTPQRACEN